MPVLSSVRRVVELGVLCSVVLPCAAYAQEPRRLATSDSIPLELATALVGAGGLGGEPQILVAALPGWVTPRVYLPPDARVVGSAFIGQTVVGIVAESNAPEVAIAAAKRELSSRGWKTPPPQPSYGGGFRSAPTGALGASPISLTLCGDGQMLTASARRHSGATTLVIYRLSSPSQYSVCAPPPVPVGMNRSPFPTLYNPPAAPEIAISTDCAGADGGWSGTSTALRTSLDGAAILDHYAKQLQDSGWTAQPEHTESVRRDWQKNDSTNTVRRVSLTVTTSSHDATCRNVSMQVHETKRP